jgi:hypothetical protein
MKVEEIAKGVANLPLDQLARFRRWAFEAGRTNQPEELDSAATKLGRFTGAGEGTVSEFIGADVIGERSRVSTLHTENDTNDALDPLEPLRDRAWTSRMTLKGTAMAKVLIVHGIFNQYGGAAQLLAAWYPALCDGLCRAGCAEKPIMDDCYCPFYRHLFRPGGLGDGPAANLQGLSQEDLELIEQVWEAAARVDHAVPGPNERPETLLYAPRMAERALAALAKSKYLADYFPLRFFGDLRQVVAYLNDPGVRAKKHRRVVQPRVRIGLADGDPAGFGVAPDRGCLPLDARLRVAPRGVCSPAVCDGLLHTGIVAMNRVSTG